MACPSASWITHLSAAIGRAICGKRSLHLREAFRRCLPVVLVLTFAASGFAQFPYVRPINWSKYAGMTGVQPGDHFGREIAVILQNQSHYLFNWIDSTYTRASLQGVSVYSFPSRAETHVRPLAHFAVGNAIAIKTGIYDPAVAGLSQSDALYRTELAIRGVAMTHRSNNTNAKTSWGQGLSTRKSWQAAYWASRGAQAAWMLWDAISAETRQAVANMVKYEADAFIHYTVPYWRNPDGTTNYPGDTKAEENAWNSRILTVAQAMMPNDPHVNLWRNKASELMVSSYSRQSDLDNTTVVDGKPIKQWIAGYNTFNDGVLVNHDLAHPGYMECHNLTYETLLDATLAEQFIPQSAFFNDQITWNAMTEVNFPVGANPYGAVSNIRPPGGTILHKRADGTPDPAPYFPNGDDWSKNLKTDVNFVLLNVYTDVRGLDAGQSVEASTWAAVELKALRDLQTRPGHTGNLYENGDWTDDPAREDIDAYRKLSQAWMIHWLDQHDQISPVSGHWGAMPEPETRQPAANGAGDLHGEGSSAPSVKRCRNGGGAADCPP
jgi:hypothetical protein